MQTQLTRLKLKLLSKPELTFFMSIFYSLEIIEDLNIPTAATNGLSIIFNPTFFINLTEDERLFLVLHEVMHVALNHMGRLGDRDPKKWNIAADYVINSELINAGYVMPKEGLYDNTYNNMTAEQVYASLPNTPDSDDNNYDLIYRKKEDKNADQALEKIILQASAQAALANQGIGKLPASISRMLDKLLNPKLPWQVILQDRMSSYREDDYSLLYPDEEYLPNLYLPTLHSEGMGEINIYVDTSGSVSKGQINIAITEINNLKHTINPKLINLISFDTEIHTQNKFTCDDILETKDINLRGGGGTCLKGVSKHIIKHNPELILIITDGWVSTSPLEDLNIDLIWIIQNNSKFKCKKGTIINIEDATYDS